MNTERTFRAPGRVNLIGGHVDHMGGPVLAMALDLETRVRGTGGGDRVRLESDSFPGGVDVAADGSDGPDGGVDGWGRYVAATVWALAGKGRAPVGFSGWVSSTVPAGAGLASSAALEVAVATALSAVAGWRLEPVALGLLCLRAEADGVGVPCGPQDQVVSAVGSPRGALLLDCGALRHHDVPLPPGAAVVVADSGVTRALADGRYAERRAELDTARRTLGRNRPGLHPFRDATAADVDALPEPVRRRARHVHSEMQRVWAAARALERADVSAAGALMVASHASDRDDYEASHPAVDALVERLVATPGVHGARMTGGGFGGMVVALVDAARAGDVVAGLPGRAWVAHPAPGAGEVGP